MENKHESIRVITRAAAFLMPLVTLCIALFVLDDIRDTIVGAVMGASATAAIFYYKKAED